jgi:hypothetical protein
MNIWPSKRFHRIAYEIKVARSDFNRELLLPEKRMPAEKYANECFFVMPTGIAKIDEIPEGWGLIELTGGKGGLRKKKNAKWRDIDDPGLGFIGSMVRRKSEDRSELPAAFWVLEGQKVDEGGLEEYIEQQVNYHKIDWRLAMDAKAAEERDEGLDQLDRLVSIIRSYIGWTYTNPDEFLTWCKAHTHGDRDREIERSFATMKRTRDMLTEILDHRKKEMK